ncbi:MAG: hypothetical protein U1E36_05775 [Rickettsiales bacterium]
MSFSIQGEPITSTAFNDLIDRLMKLPSGFNTRTRVQSNLQYVLNINSTAGAAEQKGYDAFNSGNIPESILSHKLAGDAYGHEGKYVEQGNTYSMAGQSCLNIEGDVDGKPAAEYGIPLLQKAVDIHENLGRTDHAFRDIDYLYSALGKTISHYAGSAPSTARRYQERLAGVQEQALRMSRHMQSGGNTDVTAKRVEEGEAGFSNKTCIGTDNIGECVTIIARDPATKKTGIVHLNYESDTQSLDSFFKRFGDRKLQVRLIGARFDSNPRSHANLENVLSYLSQKNVDIISADILGGYAEPSTVVVSPLTFELQEAIPGKPNPNFSVSNAAVLLADHEKHPNKPLTIQFDTAVDPHRLPVFIDADSLAIFRKHYEGKNDFQIQQSLIQNHLYDHALATHYIKGFATAYEAAWQPLQEALEDAIAKHHVIAERAAQARNALLQIGFYVGENADAMNRPIIQAIEQELFAHGTVDEHALYEAAKNSKPFDELLARLKSGEEHISASGPRHARGPGQSPAAR